MQQQPPITSPYAPDVGEVQTWLEKMIHTLRFIELVAAVIALIARMCAINAELTKLRLRRDGAEREVDDELEDSSPTPGATSLCVSAAVDVEASARSSRVDSTTVCVAPARHRTRVGG
jgi:hypothetical protein